MTDRDAPSGAPLFDDVVIVDWSAAKTPKTGKDSIWWAHARRTDRGVALAETQNPPTRAEATRQLLALLKRLVAQRRRVLAGFDFPFGYAAGMAAAMGGAVWRDVWAAIADLVEDGEDNSNNRFVVAAELNRRMTGEAFPFWGHDGAHECATLVRRERRPHTADDPAERRLCEARIKGPQPAWKLAGNGSVGSQALTGIPRVKQLLDDPDLGSAVRVWPFDTGLAAPVVAPGSVVLAEVYPSIAPPDPALGTVKDQQQVATIARLFARLDAEARLAPLFAGDPGLSPAERTAVETEEAWILGVTDRPIDPSTMVPQTEGAGLDPLEGWIRDPKEIYRRSFEIVRAEAPLSGLPDTLRNVAVRLIHACGMPDIVDDLGWGGDPVAAGRAALAAGAPVLADCRMVVAGIMPRLLPAGTLVRTDVDTEETARIAAARETTRSAAQVEVWGRALDGAIDAIGNAPTTLFALLQAIRDGAVPRPAVILGFPVGFVGAAESKRALADLDHGVPFLTLHGRRGGSGLAAAAVNAIAGGLDA
jgi:precorrin-8X/cobalt-precorrin-8 methylmutase